jgi:hypothetical protein
LVVLLATVPYSLYFCIFVADVENPWGLPPDLAGYERLLRGQMAGLDPASPASQGRQTEKPLHFV